MHVFGLSVSVSLSASLSVSVSVSLCLSLSLSLSDPLSSCWVIRLPHQWHPDGSLLELCARQCLIPCALTFDLTPSNEGVVTCFETGQSCAKLTHCSACLSYIFSFTFIIAKTAESSYYHWKSLGNIYEENVCDSQLLVIAARIVHRGQLGGVRSVIEHICI